MYDESVCLVSSHDIGLFPIPISNCQFFCNCQIVFCQSAIGNWQSEMFEWLVDPGCSLYQRSTSTSLGQPLRLEVSDAQRVLLATFSIRPHHATTEALSPPFLTSTHLAPSFVSRGGSAIRFTKILPACAGAPGARAPDVISLSPR
jgi:hypothetical protein